jgi:hypothetical protein
MNSNVLLEILAWSLDRPAWQRDALRRIFVQGGLNDGDVDDLTDISKAAHYHARRSYSVATSR